MPSFIIPTSKKEEVVDITDQVKGLVKKSKVEDGICLVYTAHATAAIIINENWDPNICLDFLDCMKAFAAEGVWRHDQVDGNGAAHMKASILGPSETIPITGNKLDLGRWQSIMFVDFDGPRSDRKIIVKISESKRENFANAK